VAVLGRGVTVTYPLPFCRDEIADCAEKAYDRLAFNEAARMFFFESNKPMKIYAAQVSGGGLSFCFDGGVITLSSREPQKRYLDG